MTDLKFYNNSEKILYAFGNAYFDFKYPFLFCSSVFFFFHISCFLLYSLHILMHTHAIRSGSLFRY